MLQEELQINKERGQNDPCGHGLEVGHQNKFMFSLHTQTDTYTNVYR